MNGEQVGYFYTILQALDSTDAVSLCIDRNECQWV